MKKIRSVGDLHVTSSITNGDGKIITNDFLTHCVEGFIKRASNYINVTSEIPFVFRERQLHSFFAPTFSEFTQAFLMEPPLQRKWSSISGEKDEDSHGWADYWCIYRNMVFIIELKHNFIAWKTGKPNEWTKICWKEANNQIKVIKDYATMQSLYANGAIRVALQVLPVYETVNAKEPESQNNLEQLLEIQNNCANLLDPKPNWFALWQLHPDFFGPHEYENTKECYPCVIFIARALEVIRK